MDAIAKMISIVKLVVNLAGTKKFSCSLAMSNARLLFSLYSPYSSVMMKQIAISRRTSPISSTIIDVTFQRSI